MIAITDYVLNLFTYAPTLAQYAHRYPREAEGGLQPGTPTFYWVVIIGSIVVSWLVSTMLKHRFSQFSQIPMPLSGKDIAERMLSENNIHDVKVVSTEGSLSDHYNPLTKTVNLSQEVYYGQHVAAAAVAAHEVGHAVQHANAYHWLTLRSKLVPVVQFSSNLVQWVIIIGVIMLFAGGNPIVLWVGVGLLAMMTLFAFVTLPVEFDASRRALAWLAHSRVGGYMEQEKARSALFWAAMTYVVAALSSLAMLMHYIGILMNRRS